MRDSVEQQNDVDKTRAQTVSEKSHTYETQGQTPTDSFVPTFGPPDEPGEVGRLGPYRIIKELGKGGMGAVYAALDTRLDRKIALKVMIPAFAAIPSAKERFLREARAAAKIAHDNVVTVYEADERDGIPYIVMQYLEGYPLDEFLKKKGEVSQSQVLRIARETAAGLEAAHKLGIIHRDIKPGNLWLEAPNGRVKLLDFGLARPVDSDVELTKSGAILGTPAYMSPEQAQGERVDQRSDLFSLGVMLYRLTTGQLPFQGNSTMAVLMALGTKEPKPVREVNPAIPDGLAQLIHDLLRKDPAQRPATATEVITRLRDLNKAPKVDGVPIVSMPYGSQNQMSLVPIPIGMPSMTNPFENIDITDSMTAEPKPKPKPKSEKKPPIRIPPIAYGGALVGLFLVIGVIVIIITNKDGSQTKIEVPDDTKVEVKDKNGKTLAKVGPAPIKSDPFVVNSVWTGMEGGVKQTLTVLERNGEKFKARYVADLGPIIREVRGTVKDGKIEWFARDAVAISGNAGGDMIGTLGEEDGKPILITKWKMGQKEGGTTLRLKTNDPDRAAAEWVIAQGGSVSINGRDIKVVADLPQERFALWNVNLDSTKTTDAGMAQLKDLTQLSFINLNGTTVSDAALVHLKRINSLAALYLNGTKVTDEGLAQLTELKNLQIFTLQSTQVTDTGLALLREFKNLTGLNLIGTKVTAQGLADFHKAVPGCKIEWDGGVIEAEDVDRKAAEWVISLGGGVRINGDNKEIRAATELPKERWCLTGVNLNGSKQLTDAGLERLNDLKSLTFLLIGDTQVGDAGLAHLKNLKNLTTLHMWATQVTSKGLAHLYDLKNLTYLDVTKTKLTAKELEAFHTVVPGCKIVLEKGTIEPESK